MTSDQEGKMMGTEQWTYEVSTIGKWTAMEVYESMESARVMARARGSVSHTRVLDESLTTGRTLTVTAHRESK
jgi:hypothetical protein